MSTVKTVAPVAWSVYNGKGETVAVFIKRQDAEEYARYAFPNWEIRGTQALASISDMLRDLKSAEARAQALEDSHTSAMIAAGNALADMRERAQKAEQALADSVALEALK